MFTRLSWLIIPFSRLRFDQDASVLDDLYLVPRRTPFNIGLKGLTQINNRNKFIMKIATTIASY